MSCSAIDKIIDSYYSKTFLNCRKFSNYVFYKVLLKIQFPNYGEMVLFFSGNMVSKLKTRP